MCMPKASKIPAPVAAPAVPAPPVAVDSQSSAAAQATEDELRRRRVIGKAQKTGPGGLQTIPALAKNQLLGQ